MRGRGKKPNSLGASRVGRGLYRPTWDRNEAALEDIEFIEHASELIGHKINMNSPRSRQRAANAFEAAISNQQRQKLIVDTIYPRLQDQRYELELESARNEATLRDLEPKLPKRPSPFHQPTKLFHELTREQIKIKAEIKALDNTIRQHLESQERVQQKEKALAEQNKVNLAEAFEKFKALARKINFPETYS